MQRLSASSPNDSDFGTGGIFDNSSVCSSRTSDSGVGLGLGGGQIPGLRRMQFPRPVQIHHVMPEPSQAARPRSLEQQQQHQLLIARSAVQSPTESASRSSQSASVTPQSPPAVSSVPPPPPAYHSNHALLSNLAEHCSGHAAYRLGACNKCDKEIPNHTDACHALGKLYHSGCFTCACCGRELVGQTFYAVPSSDGSTAAVYCTQDYLYTGFQQAAQKCAACGHMITDLILQALGRPFHPACFRCSVCQSCLDGRPFTVDTSGSVLCVADYHRLYSPKCHKCHLPITPDGAEQSSEEVLRVVSMGKDFHLSCYRCQDCGLQLSNDSSRRCYPLAKGTNELLLFCYACRLHRGD